MDIPNVCESVYQSQCRDKEAMKAAVTELLKEIIQTLQLNTISFSLHVSCLVNYCRGYKRPRFNTRTTRRATARRGDISKQRHVLELCGVGIETTSTPALDSTSPERRSLTLLRCECDLCTTVTFLYDFTEFTCFIHMV